VSLTEHAQQLDSRSVTVSRLAGELAAAAESGADPQQLRDLHEQLAEQLEALNGESSMMALLIDEAR